MVVAHPSTVRTIYPDLKTFDKVNSAVVRTIDKVEIALLVEFQLRKRAQSLLQILVKNTRGCWQKTLLYHSSSV